MSPPEAATAWEYAVPTMPQAGSDEVVICKALGGLIVIDNAAVAEESPTRYPLPSRKSCSTRRSVQVPEIVPFAARVSPAGSDPLAIDHP